MNETTELAQVIEVPAEHHGPSIKGPEVTMAIFTWITFFLLLAILYKFAWKPILQMLDQREENIRKSVENADKIKAELEKINETSKEILGKAQAEAKIILDESRKATLEAAKTIEQKAKADAQIILENAQREIKEASERVKADLKRESVEIALKLAGKLIEENLDTEKNQKLIEKTIGTI